MVAIPKNATIGDIWLRFLHLPQKNRRNSPFFCSDNSIEHNKTHTKKKKKKKPPIVLDSLGFQNILTKKFC